MKFVILVLASAIAGTQAFAPAVPQAVVGNSRTGTWG
jgi:hypothetical protein